MLQSGLFGVRNFASAHNSLAPNLSDQAVCLLLPQLTAEQGNARETLILLLNNSRTYPSLSSLQMLGAVSCHHQPQTHQSTLSIRPGRVAA